MSADIVIERLFEALIAGDRPGARRVIVEQVEQSVEAERIYTDLFWPTFELLDRLQREDQLTPLAHGLAIRLLRVLIDQTAPALLAQGQVSSGRTVLACCAEDEGGELGGQMAVDLLESSGFSVRFAGGGVPIDEIRAAVQQDRPDILVMFCSSPSNLPGIRELIDALHENGACPQTQIAVGGGVFNRAEGLAEEIGADIWADDPLELADMLVHEPERRAGPDQRTVGRTRVGTPVRKAA